ncbi:MAG: DUF2142 domain-containing protein [Methanobrevibacter sp.]|jgi:uncharacterized membrane protein|nr:DUF2142 domain-containing protein [Candidatus Methanovirga aequatorialis]
MFLDGIKVEVIFLFFCLIFGSIFAVVNPPFLTTDEDSHFLKSFDVSQGNFIHSNPIKVPKSFSIPGVLCLTPIELYTIENSKKINYTPYFNTQLNVNDMQEARSTAISYMPLPYLGVAFVIKVGELFNASPLVLMYFGRLINLLIYAIIVYFGIKIVPTGKYMFLLIALMPKSLNLAASVSADSLNLALSFFTICLFLNLAFKEDRIHRKDVFFVSVCILGLALSKQIYALLGLLFFIVPKDKFLSLKSRIIYFIYTILPSFIFFIFWSYLRFIYNNTIHQSITHQYYLTPTIFLTLISIIITEFNKWVVLFVGCFGWSILDDPLPLSIVYLYISVLIFVSIFDICKFSLSIKQKLISLFCFIMGIMTIFYVAFKWVGSESLVYICGTIWGIQGRYFIPFAPLFFLILQNQKVTNYFLYRKDYLKYLNLFIIIFVGVTLTISTYYLCTGVRN